MINLKKKLKQEISKEPVLYKLYNNKLLRTKVDEALDKGKPYAFIVDLCKEYDLDISKSAISRYKQKREEADDEDELAELVDQRISPKEDISSKEVNGVAKPIATDMQLMDLIVQKAYEGLANAQGYPSMRDALKAIETKAKITGNSYRGLTLEGYQELKVRQEAKTQAMAQIIAKYIPEEEQDKALKEMAKAEEDFYKTLNISDAQDRIADGLRKNGMEF